MDPSYHHQSQVFLNKENINIPIATKHQQSRRNPTTPTSTKTINLNADINKPKKLNILKDGFKTPTKNTATRDLSANLRRVPLGGKDGNSSTYLNIKKAPVGERHILGLGSLQSVTDLASNKRTSKRFHTPSVKSSTRSGGIPGAPLALNHKLKVLRDEDFKFESVNKVVNRFEEDDDIEFGPGIKEPPMLDVPDYYEPLTEEDLKSFEKIGTNPRLFDLSNNANDDDLSEEINYEEEFELHFSDLDDDETTIGKTNVEDNNDNTPNYMKQTFVSSAKITKKSTDVKDVQSDFYDGLSIDDLNGLLEF